MDGWDESAAAWIASQGALGDKTRQYVLDAPMLAAARGHAHALDVGCGEGRFCRMLRAEAIDAVGIDPTEALIAEARRRDPAGDYRIGRGEALDFADGEFDLVVSYLSLIDIPDADAAIAEMARVLAPGGTLLIANLNGFATAGMEAGWSTLADGRRGYVIDDYLTVRSVWTQWRGIRIKNWHRPVSFYLQALLANELVLRAFDEPAMIGPDDVTEKYNRAPWAMMMVWQKP